MYIFLFGKKNPNGLVHLNHAFVISARSKPMLNQRLFIDGHNCTVRFVGRVPVWPDDDAVGVEWDDPARGKNNGNVKDLQLFQCRPGSGSFLKVATLEKKHVIYGIPFTQAIKERYASESRVDEIKIGSKIGEVLGFDNKGLENLTSINLATKGVSERGNTEFAPLTNVLHVDLSFNLFPTFGAVQECLLLVPNVEWLSLNGNRFSVRPGDSHTIDSLTSLSLSNTLLSESDILAVVANYPNLKELVLAHNHVINLDLSDTKVSFVDLSFGQLHDVTGIRLPASATSLNLSQNHLKNAKSTFMPSESITELDVSYNQLEWADFDQLCLLYPNLTSLRINGNPFTQEEFTNTDLSVSPIDSQIIARWHKPLETLNGRAVSSQERSDSQIYFANSVLQGRIDYPRASGANKKHFEALIGLLGIAENAFARPVAAASATARQALVNVTYSTTMSGDTSHHTQRLNKQSSVQKMKFRVLRSYNLSPLHDCVIVIDNIEVYDELKTLDFYGVTEDSKVEVIIGRG